MEIGTHTTVERVNGGEYYICQDCSLLATQTNLLEEQPCDPPDDGWRSFPWEPENDDD